MTTTNCNITTVCTEKFKNIDEKIEELKNLQAKLDSRISENERRVDTIDNQLSIKLIQLEAKIDISNKLIGDKVDSFAREIKQINENVEKKIDGYFKDNTKSDTFKDEIYKIGMRIFEYGLSGGILYAIAKGIKLF